MNVLSAQLHHWQNKTKFSFWYSACFYAQCYHCHQNYWYSACFRILTIFITHKLNNFSEIPLVLLVTTITAYLYHKQPNHILCYSAHLYTSKKKVFQLFFFKLLSQKKSNFSIWHGFISTFGTACRATCWGKVLI